MQAYLNFARKLQIGGTVLIDQNRFVTTWQRAKSLADFLEQYGELTKIQASGTAVYLRSKGVPLKRFPRGGRVKKDFSQLARLANKTLKKGA